MPTVRKNFLPAVKCSNIWSECNVEFFSNTQSTLVANRVVHRHVFFNKSPLGSACIFFLPKIFYRVVAPGAVWSSRFLLCAGYLFLKFLANPIYDSCRPPAELTVAW